MPDVTFGIVNAVAAEDLDDLRAALAEQGWSAVTLDGRDVVDKATLLARADVDLPRPDDLHPHNWDAFADTLWNGLADLPGEQVAIVWTSADRMVGSDLGDLLMAVDVILGAARGCGKPVILVLVGDGPGFRRLVTTES